ncbi:MAG: type II secretion system F family protein [Clostridiales Family XIII bacterium]|nr:type II secretion system F family protein [Clostridiales Family XIII bacterium]
MRIKPGAVRRKGGGRRAAESDARTAPAVDYRYYRLGARECKRYYPIAGGVAVMLGLLFYHNPIIAAPMALLALPCRKYYEQYLAAKRRMALSIQFKDLLASVSSSFSTGRQLPEALTEAADNLRLIYAEDAPIMQEVQYMADRLIRGRESEKAVLYDFSDRSVCEDVADFVDVYFTCLTTGGDTIRAIRRASDQIIDKINIRNEIMTLTAQKKYEARILSGLPPLILLFLQFSSPDYLSPLYGTAAGALVMTLALAVQAAAFCWSAKIADIQI